MRKISFDAQGVVEIISCRKDEWCPHLGTGRVSKTVVRLAASCGQTITGAKEAFMGLKWVPENNGANIPETNFGLVKRCMRVCSQNYNLASPIVQTGRITLQLVL
jgi:hypothetical protein